MAAKKGRPQNNPVVRMSDEHRVKIANSNILNALIEHIEGKREMSSTQVSAGLGLLKKALPDMQSVDIKADVDVGAKDSLATLLAQISNTGKRVGDK